MENKIKNEKLKKGWIIFHYTCIQHILYLSASGHLGCFSVLPSVNNAAINMREQVSL